MFGIHACPLPSDALLQRYRERGAYTDCYTTELAEASGFADYVTAFYTTPLFRIERLILALAIARPSSDNEARQLAAGTVDRFAAWDVEARADNQLLLCDLHGRTRSWLMTSRHEVTGSTRLYFGSAVVPRTRGVPLGRMFRALLGFHRAYSVALLLSARRRLG